MKWLSALKRFLEIVALIGTMIFVGWQAKITRDEAKYKTRPLVCISGITLVHPEHLQSGTLEALFKIKNLGTMPAKNLDFGHKLRYAGLIVTSEQEVLIKPKCIMPGQEFGVHRVKITGQIVHDIWNKKNTLICESSISYSDERGNSYSYNSSWEFSSTGATSWVWNCTGSDYK